MSTITSHGYVLVYVGKNHPLAHVNGYAYEHRLIAEKKLGRPLLPSELVHHKDEIRQHNEEDNLVVTGSIGEHKVHHRKNKGRRSPGEDNPMILCACGCGKTFQKYDDLGRPRKYVPGCHWRKGKIGWDVTKITTCECGCGTTFHVYDKYGRPRHFITGHNCKGQRRNSYAVQ